MIEEKRNYIRDYYANKEHNLRGLVENINVEGEEDIKKIKAEINKLARQIEEKKVALQNKVENLYTKQYTATEKKVILHYRNSRSYTDYYYDLTTGYEDDDYSSEDSITYRVDNKRGEIVVVVGYDFDLASIITKKYSYSVSKDNDRVITKFLEETVIPFMETVGVRYNALTNEINDIDINWSDTRPLEEVKDNDFINTFYGVDYKGKLSLYDLRNWNLKNKSFEIIMKTAPNEIIDNLLKMELETAQPIYKILGISQETYNTAIERKIVKTVYDNKDFINGSLNEKYNIVKTEKEWLDFIDEMKNYEEDMKFYNIDYSRGYYYNRQNDSVMTLILSSYSESNVFKKYYSLGKFANYVINETINQGYDRVNDFVRELGDYLTMCNEDNIKPTLYSSYLKQTHDITSRNHRVIVEKENEEIFKSRYEDFKTYKGKKYMVVAPKSSEDLKREGDNLNHCVASYIKRVIDGECLIYFLRREKDESLITFEVRYNTIVQVRGLHNRKPTDNEVQALKEFANYRKMEVNF